MRRYHPGFASHRAGVFVFELAPTRPIHFDLRWLGTVRVAAPESVCARRTPGQYPGLRRGTPHRYPGSALSTTATRPDRAMPRAAWTWADRRGFDDRGGRLPVHTHLLDARANVICAHCGCAGPACAGRASPQAEPGAGAASFYVYGRIRQRSTYNAPTHAACAARRGKRYGRPVPRTQNRIICVRSRQ